MQARRRKAAFHGTVAAWGWNLSGQTDVPSGLTDVVAIAASIDHSVALRTDGTVAVWGANGSSAIQPPSGISEVVAIAAGFDSCLALRSDGSLVAWGSNQHGQTNIPANLSHVVSITSGSLHDIAIVGDGKPVIISHLSRRSVRIGGDLRLAALAAGAQPLRYQWQFNGMDILGATNAVLTLPGVTADAAGPYRCIVSNDSGKLEGPVTTVAVIRDPLRFETANDALQVTNEVIHLRLTGLAGTGPLIIYASTNLTQWEPIFTNAPAAGTFDFEDSATHHPSRYYQAVEQP